MNVTATGNNPYAQLAASRDKAQPRALNSGEHMAQTRTASQEQGSKQPQDAFLTTFQSFEMSRYREMPSGLKVAMIKDGEGAPATVGKKLQVRYTGWLQNGEKFDSSLEKGAPFELILGQGQVIKGWEEGLMGMRPGEKRQLVVPAKLAYGDQRVGIIPPNATLVFNIELLSLEDVNPQSQQMQQAINFLSRG